MVGADLTPTPYENVSLITTPTDVDNEKRDINPYAAATNAAIIGAPAGTLSQSFLVGWQAWYKNWQAFYATSSSLFSASGDMKLAQQKRTELTQFQAQLAQANIGVSSVPAQSAPSSSSSVLGNDPTGLAGAATNFANNTAFMIKASLVIGAVLVGYLIYESAKTARSTAPSFFAQLPAITSAGVTAAKSGA